MNRGEQLESIMQAPCTARYNPASPATCQRTDGKSMRVTALLLLFALGGALLTGCGQKGPLVLPDETAPTSAPG